MRILSALCSIAIAFSTCVAQESDPYSVRFVEHLLQYPFEMGTGFAEKQLNRLGDKVSIALIKALSEEELKDPRIVRQILPIIRGAFLVPRLIVVPEDKKPAVTMLLLNYLEADVRDDSALRKEILDLSDFIKGKSTAPR